MDTVKPESIDEIFRAFGGPTTFARAMKLKRPSTASEMRRRGSIPVEYWESLIEIAPQYGLEGLTPERLVSIHARKAAARQRRLPVRVKRDKRSRAA
jgi:hypothetical protein